MGISQTPSPKISTGSLRRDLFTTSGSWTCPVGTTYAIATILAGGGGGGGNYTSSNPVPGSFGGHSSAFGTTASGGMYGLNFFVSFGTTAPSSPNNSGLGGRGAHRNGNSLERAGSGGDGTLLVIGKTVVPNTVYPVIVGAGGSGGGSDASAFGGTGGSGYVYISYKVQ